MTPAAQVADPGGDPAGPPPRPGALTLARQIRAARGRRSHRSPEVSMVPGAVQVGGRTLQFAVSDNADAHGPGGPGTPPIWAVSIHGYFAGGQMYWRESAWLADRFGWRVVNPSLPGFGGSDPLGWHEVSIGALAEQVALIIEKLGAGPVLLLGHSMGAAVGVRYAYDHPDAVLGLVYRDGVATPAWRDRHGVVQTTVATISPNMAPFADMFVSFVLDTPDLLIGRALSTFRALIPDVRRNMRTMGLSFPVAAMLMTVDLRAEVRALAEAGLPILAEWGSFDHIVSASAAEEFEQCASTAVQWVPGGHSWMLARPQGQADVLAHLEVGQRFLAQVETRHRASTSGRRRLRQVH